ncbi:MAG: glutamate 5-kinase [Lachnospiraceae bacterium]
MEQTRANLKNKQRIVVKIGSSSIIHTETGNLDFLKLERLVRVLTDLHNQGKDVILVSSGAIGIGKKTLGMSSRPDTISQKQACAAVGQGQLMMTYQKLFMEYSQFTAQVLLTKDTMLIAHRRKNAKNTFDELLSMGVIPVVNENDTVSTEEIEFGDNDSLAAVVAAITNADLLILLSDIDGLYTDDPRVNQDATLISAVPYIDESVEKMGKDAGSDYGTGGMATKIAAARIATSSGCDMIIANANNFGIISKIMQGEEVGTLFLSNPNSEFDLIAYLESKSYLKK